jgi:lipoprotein-anchoring transpeptidase ErfK/SrfK
MEIPVMLDRLRVNATGELSDGVFELNMFDVEPPALDEIDNYRDIYQGPETVHVVERGQELALIAREYGVDMDEIVALNNIANPSLIFVGQELLIPAAGEYQPSADDAPPAPLAQGKSIVVSVDRQRIYAYENGELIHSHLTSTGLPDTPTVKGDFNIYVKHVRTNMSGPDYFLPDVPYTMYFYQGYGIHGTYWHNSFGRPMSHGCVNLPTPEAEWFFNWAEVGTLVRVI